MQGADAVAKMAPTDLLHAELPRAFNLFKKSEVQSSETQ